MNTKKIAIEKYSEKAHIILGETKEIKDELSRAGARFNRYLTHPITKVKPTVGWIISSKKVEALKAWIQHVRTDITVVSSLYETKEEGETAIDREYKQADDFAEQEYHRVNGSGN